MAKNKQSSGNGKKTGFRQQTITLFVLVLILYVGLNVISRTEGARTLVADKISNHTRLPVTIDDCGITPLLGLHLRGLTFHGIEMDDVRVSFNWLAFPFKEKPVVHRLTIAGMEARLMRAPATRQWEPLVLHEIADRVGTVLGLEQETPQVKDQSLPAFPEKWINSRTLLQLSRAKVVWLDEKGQELAYIADGDLKIEAGAFSGRHVARSVSECGHILLSSGELLRDFRIEAFSFEDSEVVLVLKMSERDGEYSEFSTQSLWEDLGGQLNNLSAL